MLDRLIEEGEQVRQTCIQREKVNSHMTFSYITGENYVKWISKCILFLEETYPGRTLTMRFIQASTNAVGAHGGEGYLNTMTGILKGIKEFESESEKR